MILKVVKRKKLLQKVYQIATLLKLDVYVVGGYVRDLYLGKEGTDMDFVVIGDALEFAATFKKQFKSGKVISYPRFGTALLEYRNYRDRLLLPPPSVRTQRYSAPVQAAQALYGLHINPRPPEPAASFFLQTSPRSAIPRDAVQTNVYQGAEAPCQRYCFRNPRLIH